MVPSLGFLVERLDTCAPVDIPSIAEEWLTGAGLLDEVGIWIADVAGIRLTDITAGGKIVQVAGSRFEEPLRSKSPVFSEGRAWLPLHHWGLILGVLSGRTPPKPDETALNAVAVVLGSALAASRAQSDYVPIARGEAQMSLPATIQQDLLPNPSFEGYGIEISGGVEPAYEVAGDVFDYSVGRDHIDLAVFDAVGHGLRSAIIASATVGAYRRLRRSELALTDIANGIDDELKKVLDTGEFVTGIVARLHLTGRLEIWNAGHVEPLLVGSTDIVDLSTANTCPPFGLGTTGEPGEAHLASGDALVLSTDGIVEARSQARESFGRLRLVDLISSHRESAPTELTRKILDAVVSHVHDPLADDATVLVVRFRPDQERVRESD